MTQKLHLQTTNLVLNHGFQEAMMKDTLERARDPNFNLKACLHSAYVHPIFKGNDDDEDNLSVEMEIESVLVPTKRQSQRNTPVPSKISGGYSPSLP
jgi:lysine-specific demethylase 3